MIELEKLADNNPEITSICESVKTTLEVLLKEKNALKKQLGIMVDATKAHRAGKKEQEKNATIDGLTELYNRTFSDQQIDKEISRAKRTLEKT